jgi:glycosyltransferase involved in cell wall biosynthesis
VSKPLHVCFLSQEYPPETGWGGIGSYTYDMAHALVAAGHQATVIARAVSEERTVDDQGVTVHRVLPSPGWDAKRVLWRLNHFWPGFAWAAMHRLKSIHSSNTVHVVESGENRADGFFIPLLRDRPRTITRLHLAWIFVDRNNRIAPDVRKRLTYWLEKQAILRADRVTAPSSAVLNLTRSWLGEGLTASVVPNPINISTFAPGKTGRNREVLFVGRLERGKGLELLERAIPMMLERVPDVCARLVGVDGRDENGRSWRLRLLDRLPLHQHRRLQFEEVPRAELASRYRAAAICVIPSLWENCPYVALEAMACGTPIVATRTGGIPEVVADGITGLLAEAGDAVGIANAICSLLENPLRLEQMGQAARLHAERDYSSEAIASQMINLYREVGKY